MTAWGERRRWRLVRPVARRIGLDGSFDMGSSAFLEAGERRRFGFGT
jgi:hypothetical protein